MIELLDAYAQCEQITKREAKNFAYGIRLLPTEKRQAMSALYAFARRVDDIGDGDAPKDAKLLALSEVRDHLALVALHDPPREDAVLLALDDAASRYPLSFDALNELVSGCEMDCRDVTYRTFDDLVVYCRCVAGSIGRLSLAVFGSNDEDAPFLADTLGVALQLTNILRDVKEDRDVMGRVYLPEEDLDHFGCAHDASGPPEAMAQLVRFEAARAKDRYETGLRLLASLDHRSRACVGAMAGIYRRLLARIEQDPTAVLSRRVSLPAQEKLWVAVRSLAGASA